MEEKVELLRRKLHEAIEKGNKDEILEASVALDVEIARLMIVNFTSKDTM